MINESDSTLSGIYTYLKQIEPALENRGWQVFYIFLSNQNKRDNKVFLIKQPESVRLKKFWQQNLWTPELFSSLKEALVKISPDVVHLHNFYYYLNTLEKAIDKRKVIQTVHDYGLVNIRHSHIPTDQLAGDEKSKFLIGQTAGLFIDRCIFNSLNNRRQLVNKFIAPTRDLTIKLNKINLATTYLPYPQRSNFFSIKREDSNNIVYAGRLERIKGMSVLLEAFKLVSQKLPASRLIFAGQGNAKPTMKKYVIDNNLSDRVSFIGSLNENELLQLYSKAQVAVCPSLWLENSPLSVIEALSAGIPVVASNIGGLPEMITNNQNGFLVKPGDQKELADKLIQLLQDKNLNQKMGQIARQLSHLRPTPKQHARALINIYNGL